MDQTEKWAKKGTEELKKANYKNIIEEYQENTAGKYGLTDKDLSDYQKKERKKIIDEEKEEQRKLLEEQDSIPRYATDLYDQQTEKAMENAGINKEIEETYKKIDTEKDKLIELAAADKRGADKETANLAEKERLQIMQSEQNFRNTLEYTSRHPQNGVLPTGVTNEMALFLNSGKSLQQIQQEYALAQYKHDQAVMKARQTADINEAYGYKTNQIKYETQIEKIFITDKYAKKALEEQREKVKYQVMTELASQGLEGKTFYEIITPLLTDSKTEGTFTTSRIQLIAKGVTDLIDGFFLPNMIPMAWGGDSLDLFKNILTYIGVLNEREFRSKTTRAIHHGTNFDYLKSTLDAGLLDELLQGLAGTTSFIGQFLSVKSIVSKGIRWGTSKLAIKHLSGLTSKAAAAAAAGQTIKAGWYNLLVAAISSPKAIARISYISAMVGMEGLYSARNALDSAHERSRILGIKPNGWADVTYDDWYYGAIGAAFDVIGLPIIGKVGEAALKGIPKAFRVGQRLGSGGRQGIRPMIKGGALGTVAAGGLLGAGIGVAGGLEAIEEIATTLANMAATYGVDMSDLIMEIINNDPNNSEFNQQIIHTAMMAIGGAGGMTAGHQAAKFTTGTWNTRQASRQQSNINENRSFAQEVFAEMGDIELDEDTRVNIENNVARANRMHNARIREIQNDRNMTEEEKAERIDFLNRQKGRFNFIMSALAEQHKNDPAALQAAINNLTNRIEDHTNNFEEGKTPSFLKILKETFESGDLSRDVFYQHLSRKLRQNENLTEEEIQNLEETFNETSDVRTSKQKKEDEKEDELPDDDDDDDDDIGGDNIKQSKSNSNNQTNNTTNQNGDKNGPNGDKGDEGEGGDTKSTNDPNNPQTPNNKGGAANQAQESKDSKDGEAKEALDATTVVGESGLQSGGITRTGRRSKIPDPEKQRQASKETKSKQNRKDVNDLAEILAKNFEKIFDEKNEEGNKHIEEVIGGIIDAARKGEEINEKTLDKMIEEVANFAFKKEMERQGKLGDFKNKLYTPEDIEEMISNLFQKDLIGLDGKNITPEQYQKLRQLFRKIIFEGFSNRGQEFTDGISKLSKAEDKLEALRMEIDDLTNELRKLNNKDPQLAEKFQKQLEEKKAVIEQRIEELKKEMNKYKEYIDKLDVESLTRRELEAYYYRLANDIKKLSENLEKSGKMFGELAEETKNITLEELRNQTEGKGLISFLSSIINNYLDYIKNYAKRIINHLFSNVSRSNFNEVRDNSVKIFEMMSSAFSDLHSKMGELETAVNDFTDRMEEDELKMTFYVYNPTSGRLIITYSPTDKQGMPVVTYSAVMNNRYHARLLERLTGLNRENFDDWFRDFIIDLAYPTDKNQMQTKKDYLIRMLSLMYNEDQVDRVLFFIKNNKDLEGGAKELGKLLSNTPYNSEYMFQVVSAMMYAYLANIGNNVTQSNGITLPENFKGVDTNFVQPNASFAVNKTFDSIMGNFLDNVSESDASLIKSLTFFMMTKGGREAGSMSVKSYKPSTINRATKMYNVFKGKENGTLQDVINEKDKPENNKIYEELKAELTALNIWHEDITEEEKATAVNDIISFYAKEGNGLNYFKLLEKIEELENTKPGDKSSRGKAVKKNPFKESGNEISKNVIIINDSKSGVLEMLQAHEDKIKKDKLEEGKNANTRVRTSPQGVRKGDPQAKELRRDIAKLKRRKRALEKQQKELGDINENNKEEHKNITDEIQTINDNLKDLYKQLDKVPYTAREQSMLQGRQVIDGNIDSANEKLTPLKENGEVITKEQYQKEMNKLKFGLNANEVEVSDVTYIPNYKFVEVTKKDKDGNEIRDKNGNPITYVIREQHGYIKLTKDNAKKLLNHIGIKESSFNFNGGIMAEELKVLEQTFHQVGETMAFVEFILEERAKGNKPTFYFDYSLQPSGRQQIANTILTIHSNRMLRQLFTNKTDGITLTREEILKKEEEGQLTQEFSALYYTFAEILGFELSYIQKADGKYYISYPEEQHREIKKHVIGFLKNDPETNQLLENYIKENEDSINLMDEESNRFFNAKLLLKWNEAQKTQNAKKENIPIQEIIEDLEQNVGIGAMKSWFDKFKEEVKKAQANGENIASEKTLEKILDSLMMTASNNNELVSFGYFKNMVEQTKREKTKSLTNQEGQPNYNELVTHIDGPASGSAQKNLGVKGNPLATQTAFGNPTSNVEPEDYFENEKSKSDFKKKVKEAKANGKNLTLLEIAESLKDDIPYGSLLYNLFQLMNKKQLNKETNKDELTGVAANGNMIISALVDYLGLRNANEISPDEAMEVRKTLRDLSKRIVQPIMFGATVSVIFKSTNETELLKTIADRVVSEICQNLSRYKDKADAIAISANRVDSNGVPQTTINDYLNAMKQDKSSTLSESAKQVIEKLIKGKKVTGRIGNTNLKEQIYALFNESHTVNNANLLLAKVNYEIYNKVKPYKDSKDELKNIELFEDITSQEQNLPFNDSIKNFLKNLKNLLALVKDKTKDKTDQQIINNINKYKNSKSYQQLIKILTSAGYIKYDFKTKKYTSNKYKKESISTFISTYVNYYSKVAEMIDNTSSKNFFGVSIFHEATEPIRANMIQTENAKEAMRETVVVSFKLALIKAYKKIFADRNLGHKFEEIDNAVEDLDKKIQALDRLLNQIFDENYYDPNNPSNEKFGPYQRSQAKRDLREEAIKNIKEVLSPFYKRKEEEGESFQGTLTVGKEGNTQEITRFRRQLENITKDFSVKIFDTIITSITEEGRISTFTVFGVFREILSSVFPLIEHFNESVNMETIIQKVNPIFTIYDAGYINEADFVKFAKQWNDGLRGRINAEDAGNIIKTLATMVYNMGGNIPQYYKTAMIQTLSNIISYTMFISPEYNAHIKYRGKELKTDNSVDIKSLRTKGDPAREHIFTTLKAIQKLTDNRIVVTENANGTYNVDIDPEVDAGTKIALNNMLNSIPFVVVNIKKFEEGRVLGEYIVYSKKDTLNWDAVNVPFQYEKLKTLRWKQEYDPDSLTKEEKAFLDEHKDVDLKKWEEAHNDHLKLVNSEMKITNQLSPEEVADIHENAYTIEALKETIDTNGYVHVAVYGNKSIDEYKNEISKIVPGINPDKIRIHKLEKYDETNSLKFSRSSIVPSKFLFINKNKDKEGDLTRGNNFVNGKKDQVIPMVDYIDGKLENPTGNKNAENMIKKANNSAKREIDSKKGYTIKLNKYPLDEVMKQLIEDLKTMDEKEALKNAYMNLLVLTRTKSYNSLHTPTIVLQEDGVFSNEVDKSDFKDKNGNTKTFDELEKKLTNMLSKVMNREADPDLGITKKDVKDFSNMNGRNNFQKAIKDNNKEKFNNSIDSITESESSNEMSIEEWIANAEKAIQQMKSNQQSSSSSQDIDQNVDIIKDLESEFTNKDDEYTGQEQYKEKIMELIKEGNKEIDDAANRDPINKNDENENQDGNSETNLNQNENQQQTENTEQADNQQQAENNEQNENQLNNTNNDILDDPDSDTVRSALSGEVESSETLSIKANQVLNGSQAVSPTAQSTNNNSGWTHAARERAINEGRAIDRNEVNSALQRYANSIGNGFVGSLIKKVINAFMSVLSNDTVILIVPDSAMPDATRLGATFMHTKDGVRKQYIVVRESSYLQNNDILLHEIGHAAIGNAFSMANFKGLNNIMSKFKALKGRVISKIHELYKTPQGRETLKEMGLLDKDGNFTAIYDAMTNKDTADEEFMMYFVTNARRLEFLNNIAENANNDTQVGPIRSFIQAIGELLKHGLYIISLGTFFKDEINNPNKSLAESLVDISNSLVDYSTEASARKAEESKIQDVRDKINEGVRWVIDRIPVLNVFQDHKVWAARVKGYVSKKQLEEAKENIRQRIMDKAFELNDNPDSTLDYLGNFLKATYNVLRFSFFKNPLEREVALEVLNEALRATDNIILKEFRAILRSFKIIDVENLSEIEKLIGQKTALDKMINQRVNIESQIINDVFENMIGKDKIKELAENGKLEEVRRATQVFFVTGMASSPFVVRNSEEETNRLFDEEFKDNLHTLFFGDYNTAMDKVDESMDMVKEQIANIINNRILQGKEKRTAISAKDISNEAVSYFMRQTYILGHQRIVGGTTDQGLQNVNSILSAIYNIHDKKENYLSKQNLTKDGKLRFMDLYTAMVRNVESQDISSINQNKELEIALYNLTTKQAIAAIKDEHPDEIAPHYTRYQKMIDNLMEARGIKDEIPADFVNSAAYMARRFNTLNSVSLLKKVMRVPEENSDLYIKYIRESNKLGDLYAQPRRDIDAINKQKERVDELYEKVQQIEIRDEFSTQDFRKDYSRDMYETYQKNNERRIISIARLDTSEIPADVAEEYYKSTTNNQSTTDFKSAVIYNVRRGWKIADPRDNTPLEVNENDQIEYMDGTVKKTMSLEDFIKVSDNITFIYDGLDINEDVTVAYLLLGNSFNNKGTDLDGILHFSETTKDEIKENARNNYDKEIKSLLDNKETNPTLNPNSKKHKPIPSNYNADPLSDSFKDRVYDRLMQSERSFRPIAGSQFKLRTQMNRIKFENLTGVDTSIMSVLTEMIRTDMTRKMQEELNSQVINSLIKDNDKFINSTDEKLKKEVKEKYGIIYIDDFEPTELTASERIIRASNRNKTALLAPSVLDQIGSYVNAYNEGVTEESKKIKQLYVSPEVLELVQGIQHQSLSANLVYSLSGKDNILGSLAQNPKYVKLFEQAALWLQQFVNDTKQNVVIVNPKVLLSNAASQLMSLNALGLSPKQIFDDYITIKADIKRFEDDAITLYQLRTNRDMLVKNSDLENPEVQNKLEGLNKQIIALEKQIKGNRVYYPMSNGADTNITDETQQDTTLVTGLYKKGIDTALSKTGLKTIIKNLGYDPDNVINELSLSTTSWWYKKGQEINRNTDMIPKIIAYEKYVKDKLEPEDALHKAQAVLINYNTPLESGLLRTIDRLGIIPFARYSIRAIPALVKSFTDRPVDTVITMILGSFMETVSKGVMFGDFFAPSIYNDAPTSLLNKIKDPFRTVTDLRNVFRHAPFLDLFM